MRDTVFGIAEPRPAKVLIALADASARESVNGAAARLGLSALHAQGVSDAAALYRQHGPIVLVTTLSQATDDGVTLVRGIRTLSKSLDIPAVVLLTQSVEEDVAGYDAGADHCLRLPVQDAVLEATLRAVVRKADEWKSMAFSLQRAQDIAHAVRDGMVTIDAAGAITWANSSFASMFGYGLDELLGGAVDRLVLASSQPMDAAGLRDCIDRHIADADGATCEMQGRRKDGGAIAIEIKLSPMTHDGALGYVGVIRDIDARRVTEAQLAEKTAQLVRYRDEQEAEGQLAQEIMARLRDRGGLADSRLNYAVWPAQRFSGDVVVAARSATGRLYVMLADAMGHGLAAAISLLPAITVFYGMAARNLPLGMLIGEMNAKLRNTLPVGRFVAATLLCIHEQERSGEVWIGGTPDALWLDGTGEVIERFVSNRVPLGIIDSSPLYAQPGLFEWREAGQIFACSDGLGEARDTRGEHFGCERMLASLAGVARGGRIGAVENAVRNHLAGAAAADDIALLTIDLV